MTIRVLLVDDHRIFREALRILLAQMPDILVVGEAGDGQQAIELARQLVPDIVCMDIGMPGINGIKATRELRSACPAVKVIALSTHADNVYVMDMMAAGASAYVTKAEGGQELLRAIESVGNGRQYLCAGITDTTTRTLVNQRHGRTHELLGDRERQVLCLVAKGMSSQQIAAQLDIATGTVDVHRRNIMRKLDLHNAVDLTRYVITTGMVCP
jgi:DNA-binding NarL/FixJ family response regulator